MTTPRRAGVLRLLAAVAVGGGLLAAASTDLALGPGEAGPAGPAAVTSAPGGTSYLTEAVLACPGVVGDGVLGASGETRLRGAVAPAEVFAGVAAPNGPPGLELALSDGPDVVAEEVEDHVGTTVTDDRWGIVRSRGEAAAGTVGGQLTLDPDPGTRGWALTACSPPADVAHLVGGGDGAGQVGLLVLTNPAADPVTVDIDVFGEDGPAATVGGSGLVVPPHGRLVERLDALAPSVRHPVVRVAARGGPVTAHLADRHRQGTTDLGRELLAAAAAPARELVVPALPAGEGQAATLRLFAPDGQAVVELRALTGGGAVVPDPAVVRVPAGSTVEVEMADLPEGAALRLRADAPVTAGARLQLAPASDEPVVLDDATRTAGPDGEAGTAAPDDATRTAGPDGEAGTAAPDDATRTAGPTAQPEPVRRPAGESAWVAAVPLSAVPLGLALPDLADLPGPDDEGEPAGADEHRPVVSLAVSALDATTAVVIWLDERGRTRTQELSLAHDTTEVLEVPARTVGLWVRPGEGGRVAAAVHLRGGDVVGPYATATSLSPVPWTREVPPVVPVLP